MSPTINVPREGSFQPRGDSLADPDTKFRSSCPTLRNLLFPQMCSSGATKHDSHCSGLTCRNSWRSLRRICLHGMGDFIKWGRNERSLIRWRFCGHRKANWLWKACLTSEQKNRFTELLTKLWHCPIATISK